jgi:hypothetical protein
VSKYPVVSSREERDIVFADLRRVLDLSTRMPNFPFLIEEGTDSFCQDVTFNAGSFGPFLERLSLQFNDEFVSGARLDPRHFLDNEDIRGNYSAFHIPSSDVADKYWDALTYEPNDSIANAINSNWNVLCATGSSGSWAIWGERRIGIAIVRTAGSDVSWRVDSDWFLPPIEAIHAFIEPEFNRQPLSAEFRQTFLENVRPTCIDQM